MYVYNQFDLMIADLLYTQLVYVCLTSQIVRGQWLLTIRMIQFQNLYNVEIRPGQANPVCCCDQSFCQPSFDAFTESCTPLCDTYFVVSTESLCQASDQCQVFMETDPITNSATTTDTSYEFHFVLNAYPTEPVSKSTRI